MHVVLFTLLLSRGKGRIMLFESRKILKSRIPDGVMCDSRISHRLDATFNAVIRL